LLNQVQAAEGQPEEDQCQADEDWAVRFKRYKIANPSTANAESQ
jgi:hypothetical protein